MFVGIGIFALILLTVSWIVAKIDDKKCMSKPSYLLDDETPVYTNGRSEVFINKEKVIHKIAYTPDGELYLQEVGSVSGKVYFDPYLCELEEIKIRNEQSKDNAIELGLLAYCKYDSNSKKRYTCEVETGKYIWCLWERADDNTYWKSYINMSVDNCLEKEIDWIQITKEEYNKLNITGRTHIAFRAYSEPKKEKKRDNIPKTLYEVQKEERKLNKKNNCSDSSPSEYEWTYSDY